MSSLLFDHSRPVELAVDHFLKVFEVLGARIFLSETILTFAVVSCSRGEYVIYTKKRPGSLNAPRLGSVPPFPCLLLFLISSVLKAMKLRLDQLPGEKNLKSLNATG